MLTLVLTVLLSLPLVPQTDDQARKPTLAELAREQKARKAEAKGEVLLITNADLAKVKGRVSGGSEAKTEEGEAAPKEGEAETTEPATAETKDLASFQASFSEARMDLKNSVNQKLVLELKINNLRNALYNTSDGSTVSLIHAQLEEALQALKEAETTIAENRKALDSLEAEAKSAGLTPRQIRDLKGEVSEPESIITETTPLP